MHVVILYSWKYFFISKNNLILKYTTFFNNYCLNIIGKWNQVLSFKSVNAHIYVQVVRKVNFFDMRGLGDRVVKKKGTSFRKRFFLLHVLENERQ